MRTYSAKLNDIKARWWLIDAEDLILGRMSAHVANVLRGKHKPTYTPHMDDGDHVIIINADKVKITGKKREQRRYFWHTGYPGGIKERTVEATFASAHPERVVHKSIERMIPKGPLGRKQLKKLHVYAGSEHPHAAQKPETLDFAARNPKNKRAA